MQNGCKQVHVSLNLAVKAVTVAGLQIKMKATIYQEDPQTLYTLILSLD